MKVAFDELPHNSRLWVYQAQRSFSEKDLNTIRKTIDAFVGRWEAHGNPLTAGYDIRYNQFIILAVDESIHGATGCSIDGSVALVRQLEQELKTSLLDRGLVAVESAEGLKLFPFNEIKSSVEQGAIAAEDLVFNNAVSTLADFQANWKVPASNSWLKRHFKVAQ